MPPPGSRKFVRKKTPQELAVINQAQCTGCEACITVCPVDCIWVVPGGETEHPGVFQLVEVDLQTCIGCEHCAEICPWHAIDMWPFDEGLRVRAEKTLRAVVPDQPPPPAGATTEGATAARS
jgi:electron transport complex protein RnfB